MTTELDFARDHEIKLITDYFSFVTASGKLLFTYFTELPSCARQHGARVWKLLIVHELWGDLDDPIAKLGEPPMEIAEFIVARNFEPDDFIGCCDRLLRHVIHAAPAFLVERLLMHRAVSRQPWVLM